MAQEKELIDVEAARGYVASMFPGDPTLQWLGMTMLEKLPKVRVTEVVHGRWVNAAGCRTICDHCGEYPLYDYWGRQKLSNYCPNCGKKMGSEPALSEGAPAGYCNRAVGDPSD